MSQNIDDCETGTYVLMTRERLAALVNVVGYEVADGDLILLSKAGKVLTVDHDRWQAIGTLERDEDGSWIAFEQYNSSKAARP